MMEPKKNTKYKNSSNVWEFEKRLGFKNKIKWTNVIVAALYHILGVFWSYWYAFPAKWQTLVFAWVVTIATAIGVTGGVHRLWTHRAYKANFPLRVILLTFYTMSGQNSVQQWVRDHRVHHKFSDTDADPQNIHRGIFFSHIGWLLTKKNDQVLTKGKEVDMSDINADPLLRFHERYFPILKLMLCWVLPTMTNIWFWNEDWKCAVAWQCFIRYLYAFHCELTVNSLAHSFGYKPYNRDVHPAENRFVATITLGEGWHNYHHAFPFDYKAAEHYDLFNFTTRFIEFFAYIGWATDLKQATPQMIDSISKRLGDGTPIHFPLESKGKSLDKFEVDKDKEPAAA